MRHIYLILLELILFCHASMAAVGVTGGSGSGGGSSGGGVGSGTNDNTLTTNFTRYVVTHYGNSTNITVPVNQTNSFDWYPASNAAMSLSGSFVADQAQTLFGTIVITNPATTSIVLPVADANGQPIVLKNPPSTNLLAIRWDGTRVFGDTGLTLDVPRTNYSASIATNATSVTVDFGDTANKQEYNAWFHLTTNLVVSPTNLVTGRTLEVYFATNSLTYDVTITNTAGNPVRWNFNVSTNGSTSFTKTNTLAARVFLTAETNGTILAELGYYR